jgi:hypothetical protein
MSAPRRFTDYPANLVEEGRYGDLDDSTQVQTFLSRLG